MAPCGVNCGEETPVAWQIWLFGQGGGAADSLIWVPGMVGVAVLFYFMLLKPQQREQKLRQSMLENLKKNDRVVTVGGVYGVVTNVRKDADEVTIKVDETTNTKLRVTMASIVRITSGEPSADPSSAATT